MVSVLAERSIGLASSWSEYAVAQCVDNRRMISRALAALQLSDDHKDLLGTETSSSLATDRDALLFREMSSSSARCLPLM